MGFVNGLLFKSIILYLFSSVKDIIEIYNIFDAFFMFYIRGPPYHFQKENDRRNKLIKILKRRKINDNPYNLEYDNELNIYRIIFIDSKGHEQILNVDIEIYNVFNESELKDLSILNEFDRHIEHLEHSEESLYKKATLKNDNVEKDAFTNILYDDLKKEINKLPDIQKRRLKKYFFNDMTLNEISKEEKCSIRAVKSSIDIALRKLKEKIK